MRPTKERLEEIRKTASAFKFYKLKEPKGEAAYSESAGPFIDELFEEIDALESELRGKPPLNVQASKTIPQLLDQIDALEKERDELKARKCSHGPYEMYGTDGCEKCDYGRIEMYRLNRLCLECQHKDDAQAGSRPHMSSQGVHAGCNYLAAIDSGFCNKCNRFFTSSATSRGDDNGP